VKNRITAILLAAFVPFALPHPTTAYDPSGDEYDDAVISDGTLYACFEADTPVYENREILIDAFNTWSQALDILVLSLGSNCGPLYGQNIEVLWEELGSECGQPPTLADTTTIASAGEYSNATIRFNEHCEEQFYWGSSDVIPPGDYDAFYTALHEMGHALGLNDADDFSVRGDPITTDDKQVLWTFDTSDKKDVTTSWASGPKWSSGFIYSGSLDPSVGNYSQSSRPNLPAGEYRFVASIRNASASPNPNGVSIQFFQGTTWKWTSASVGISAQSVAANLTWTAQADFRFSVPFSKAEILEVEVFRYDDFTDGPEY
jgi:hypothetical protein